LADVTEWPAWRQRQNTTGNESAGAPAPSMAATGSNAQAKNDWLLVWNQSKKTSAWLDALQWAAPPGQLTVRAARAKRRQRKKVAQQARLLY
jgi:hypothetical protein